MKPVKAPFWLPWLYPGVTWHRDRTEKCLFLTFDDGPVPNVTEEIILILKSFGVPATFFCVGENITRNPQIFNSLKEHGHQVGNHTYNHLNGWKTDHTSYLENVERCEMLTETGLFRPPYSLLKRTQLKALRKQYEVVLWDVLSRDYDPNVRPEQCLNHVLQYSQPGSIIVFHDHIKAWQNARYALPRAIEHWLQEGYRFETLGQRV